MTTQFIMLGAWPSRRAFSPAFHAARRVVKREESVGKTIVVILPDWGEHYLSSALFEGLFDAQGLAV